MAAKRSAAKSPSAAQQIAKELHQQLVDSVTDLVTSDAWPKLLQAMVQKNGTELSRFSFNNMLMILSQCPEATAVVTAKAWGERGRWMLKGSKAIRVYAPLSVKDREDENKTKIVGFRMIPEFDVSQTEPTWQHEGADTYFITPAVGRRPSVVKQLQGDAPAKMWQDVAGQIEQLGYTIERGNTGGANGYTEPKTMKVRVSDQVSPAQATKTLAHELAHILADHVSDMAEYQEHRGFAETVAESFAFMVCAYYKLDSTQYSAPYIGTWAGREDAEQILKTVTRAGSQVLAMFRTFVAAVESPKAEQANLQAA